MGEYADEDKKKDIDNNLFCHNAKQCGVSKKKPAGRNNPPAGSKISNYMFYRAHSST
jgi:hypothetical protein